MTVRLEARHLAIASLTSTQKRQLFIAARHWARHFKTGDDPQDLVHDAIARFLEGRRKTWDGRAVTLVPFLKLVIRSIAGERLPRRRLNTLERSDIDIREEFKFLESNGVDRLTILTLAFGGLSFEPRSFDERYAVSEKQLRRLIAQMREVAATLRRLPREDPMLGDPFVPEGAQGLPALLSGYSNFLELFLIVSPARVRALKNRRLNETIADVLGDLKRNTNRYHYRRVARMLGRSEGALKQWHASWRRRKRVRAPSSNQD
jgi:hypothetical protein